MWGSDSAIGRTMVIREMPMGDAQMKFDASLSEFNRQFAAALLPSFGPGIEALQSEGALLFRGPIPNRGDHVGTHVAVFLMADIHSALEAAAPEARAQMTDDLVSNLGTQIRARYNPNKVGDVCLDVVGTLPILRG
jgi:hypothetical protein